MFEEKENVSGLRDHKVGDSDKRQEFEEKLCERDKQRSEKCELREKERIQTRDPSEDIASFWKLFNEKKQGNTSC